MDIEQELEETFTENKSELISQFEELIKKFKLQSSKSAKNENINNQYQYEDIDIQAILVNRKSQLIHENDQAFSKPVHIMAAVDNIVNSKIIYRQLEQRLKEDKYANKEGERIILIPCNLGNYHWVGILVEFQEDGKIARAEYIDSLRKIAGVPQSLQEQWSKVYKVDLQIKKLLHQDDVVSCGVFTVENLLLSARNLIKLDKHMDVQQFRQLHLECLEDYNNKFYQAFYKKQKDNEPTVAELHQQLGYLKDEIVFSKQEIDQILEIKKCLANISNNRIKKAISNVFKPNKKYKEHAQHLNAIRTVLQQQKEKLESDDDQKSFKKLIEILFDIEYQNKIPFNLQDIRLRPGLEYEAILAITKKYIAQEKIDAIQEQIKKQIAEDEKLARELQAKEWKEADKKTPSSRKRGNSEDREESVAKRARSESSERSETLIFSTPAKNFFGSLSASTPSGSKRYSGNSVSLATAATTARNILLGFSIIEGKISIIVNSGQRPDTAISGSQGDHITAYTALLQMVCSIVDGEDVHEAPHMLYETAKCFISNPDRLREFNKLFLKRQQEVEEQFFPREIRKSLTYSLRKIQKHASNLFSINNAELKKAIQILCRTGAENSLNVDQLRDAIKFGNQSLFAQLVVEVGNQLLKDYNKEETSALPKINVAERDTREGNRVKNAMKILRLLNKLIGFKQEMEIISNNDKKKVEEDFKFVCKNIIQTTIPNIKDFDKQFNRFLFTLGLIREKDIHIGLENIEKNINKIDLSKIKFEMIGKLFNDLFDFKHKNVEVFKRGQHDGEIVNGKIVFQDPEDVLYKVTKRHVNFMYIAFKNLNILSKFDKQAEEKVIKGFLELVVKNPQGNDNAQGWGNYSIIPEGEIEEVRLSVDLIFNKIKDEFKPSKLKLRW